MRKKYISIIELLSQTIDWLQKKDNYIHFLERECYRVNAGVMSKLPVSILSDSHIDEAGEVKMRSISAHMDHGQSTQMYMPEFLEIELLRNSDFQYTDEELACLDQLMMWQVRQWCHIKQDRSMRHFLSLLQENELLYELDLEDPQDNGLDLLLNIYKEHFTFAATSPQAYTQKNISHYYIAAPRSTLDALRIMSARRHSCHDSLESHYSRYLLYLPLIAVFSILESEVVDDSYWTLSEYQEYTSYLHEDLLGVIEQTIQGSETALVGADDFSHGFALDNPRHVESDRYLIAKTVGRLLYHIKKIATEKNTPIVWERSIQNLSSDDVRKIHVLLNRAGLSWGANGDE